MTDTTVKSFDSTMSGAPSLSGTVGTLIGLLDACLVDGFGSITLDSLAVASNVATATYSSGHGFTMAGETGPVLTLAGATPSGLNGEWRVTITSTTQFTFTTSGLSDQTATGTITAKRSPLGWTKPFSGTNKAVYLPALPYVQCYLRVQDDSATPTSASGRWAKICGYETMSDVDTGTGLFPTAAQKANGLSIVKSSTSNSTARAWWLVGDGGIFYLGTFWNPDYPISPDGHLFGDINSLKSGDAYSSHILGSPLDSLPGYPGYLYGFAWLGNAEGRYLARNYTQLGSAITATWVGDHGISTALGNGGLTYPHPIDNGLLFAPVGVVESGGLRSRALPGLYQPLHTTPLAHLGTVSSIPDLPNRTLQAFSVTGYNGALGQGLFDITGPWR